MNLKANKDSLKKMFSRKKNAENAESSTVMSETIVSEKKTAPRFSMNKKQKLEVSAPVAEVAEPQVDEPSNLEV